MGKLTARRVETASPGKHEDGDGLRLVVSESGNRRWVVRISVAGKRREMGLGGYPVVVLAKARELALEARKQAREGTDPVEARKAPAIPTFEDVAAQYIDAHRPGWSNAKHGFL